MLILFLYSYDSCDATDDEPLPAKNGCDVTDDGRDVRADGCAPSGCDVKDENRGMKKKYTGRKGKGKGKGKTSTKNTQKGKTSPVHVKGIDSENEVKPASDNEQNKNNTQEGSSDEIVITSSKKRASASSTRRSLRIQTKQKGRKLGTKSILGKSSVTYHPPLDDDKEDVNDNLSVGGADY